MEVIKKIKIGNVDFFGQFATAFREIHANGDWSFVIVTENKRIVMLTY